MSQRVKRQRRYHEAQAPVEPAIRQAVEQALAAVAPVRRDQALPLLQQIQARLGHLPAPALAYASRQSQIPLAELNALVSFYDQLTTELPSGPVVYLCDDIVCRSSPGAQALRQYLHASGCAVHSAPCLGQCDRAPAALQVACGVGASGLAYGGYGEWRLHLAERAVVRGWPAGYRPLLLSRCARYAPDDLAAYERTGGLAALRKARSLTPAELVALVKASKLVGRGGAAFPTGLKWEGVLSAPTPHGPGPDGASKYVVVNADESEPGTFTNRLLLEEDPLAVLEAALVAAHAVGAEQIYIYIRGEYPAGIEQIKRAIGAIGPLAEGVRMEIRCGSGAYVCGEETALFASIEGERGEPRVKPPFPTTHGLFGRPTLINNVETLHNLLPLLLDGPEAWNAVQPKLFSISGHIARPGIYEVPLGTPLSGLIDLAEGPTGEIQAVLMGGAAGMFIGPEKLHTPLDFRAMQEAGATLGSGAVMIFDQQTDLWEIAQRAARFFAEESCGKCVPCRIGTARQVEMVGRLAAGETEWLPLHQSLSQAMADASICGLGQAATSLVRSLLTLKGVQ